MLPDQLRKDFSDVIGPEDAGYDTARAAFFGEYDRRPAVIVRPVDTSDVAGVVTLARESGSTLAVRAGGHSVAGHSSTDGGIMLDLGNLREMDVDVAQRTAWAQSGLTAGEYTTTAGAHGLATGFGDTGSVGIGGLTLGGGVGLLSRKYGLTVDDLLAAEIVTADGQVRVVHEDSEPDLFWAIRGGGGNFGVVTRFRFQLHEVTTVTAGMLMLPATPELIASFVAEMQEAPDELSGMANVMVAPPMPFVPTEYHGKPVIMAVLCHAGPVDEGERTIDRLRAVAPPIVDMVRPMPYAELYQMFGEGPPIRPQRQVSRTVFVDAVDADTGEAITEGLHASKAPMAAIQLRPLGGAIARVPADATAYPHRDRQLMANPGAMFENAADTPEHDAWVAGLAAALGPRDATGYVNFLGEEGTARDAYPGPTWDRLVAVKRRYDPTNLFRLNHNIPPGT